MLTLTSPVETPWHRVRAAWKLAALCAFTVLVLVLASPMALGDGGHAVAALYLPGGWVFARAGLRMLWPLWPFLVIVAALALVDRGLRVGRRGGAAAGGGGGAANLVTMTTRLSDMIAVVERLAAPLARLGPVAPHAGARHGAGDPLRPGHVRPGGADCAKRGARGRRADQAGGWSCRSRLPRSTMPTMWRRPCGRGAGLD